MNNQVGSGNIKLNEMETLLSKSLKSRREGRHFKNWLHGSAMHRKGRRSFMDRWWHGKGEGYSSGPGPGASSKLVVFADWGPLCTESGWKARVALERYPTIRPRGRETVLKSKAKEKPQAVRELVDCVTHSPPGTLKPRKQNSSQIKYVGFPQTLTKYII